ncbi:unnamed protein product [Closterium sp. NIES-64]|nr:unnamed protein product [Closterium sp. NIES-64]
MAQLRQLLTGEGLAGRVTLTTDIWTSENNVAFMVVTAHRVTSDLQLQQMVIDFRPLEGRHTGDKIAGELEQVIGQWAFGGGEFFDVTTNNVENNNRAVRLLTSVADDTPGSRQYAMKVEPVVEALRRLRAVASYIEWSLQWSERYIQKQYDAGRAATEAEEGTKEGGGEAGRGWHSRGGGDAGRGGQQCAQKTC